MNKECTELYTLFKQGKRLQTKLDGNELGQTWKSCSGA